MLWQVLQASLLACPAHLKQGAKSPAVLALARARFRQQMLAAAADSCLLAQACTQLQAQGWQPKLEAVIRCICILKQNARHLQGTQETAAMISAAAVAQQLCSMRSSPCCCGQYWPRRQQTYCISCCAALRSILSGTAEAHLLLYDLRSVFLRPPALHRSKQAMRVHASNASLCLLSKFLHGHHPACFSSMRS